MFFMAMLLFPNVQKKAQEEIDTVVGDSRLPTLEDQDQLQYVWRIVQEVLRWGPVTPIGGSYTSKSVIINKLIIHSVPSY